MRGWHDSYCHSSSTMSFLIHYALACSTNMISHELLWHIMLLYKCYLLYSILTRVGPNQVVHSQKTHTGYKRAIRSRDWEIMLHLVVCLMDDQRERVVQRTSSDIKQTHAHLVFYFSWHFDGSFNAYPLKGSHIQRALNVILLIQNSWNHWNWDSRYNHKNIFGLQRVKVEY